MRAATTGFKIPTRHHTRSSTVRSAMPSAGAPVSPTPPGSSPGTRISRWARLDTGRRSCARRCRLATTTASTTGCSGIPEAGTRLPRFAHRTPTVPKRRLTAPLFPARSVADPARNRLELVEQPLIGVGYRHHRRLGPRGRWTSLRQSESPNLDLGAAQRSPPDVDAHYPVLGFLTVGRVAHLTRNGTRLRDQRIPAGCTDLVVVQLELRPRDTH